MFVTGEFWLLALVAWLICARAPGRWQNGLLLLFSYLIYAYFEWRFLALLIVASTVNYLIGRRLAPNMPRRSIFFICGILFNLGLLAYFKYAGFFAESFSAVLTRIGVTISPAATNI